MKNVERVVIYPLLWSIAAMIFTGCAVKVIDSKLVVKNHLRDSISEIRYQNCGQENSARLFGQIAAKQKIEINSMQYSDCVNLLAYDMNGEILAQQRKVSFPPTFIWHIH